ncbi:MAG TPA: LacI family DNA-binding transcriptional regulator [Steroidobacteraceae bacterium]|jgi:LacI family transcriptional regulator
MTIRSAKKRTPRSERSFKHRKQGAPTIADVAAYAGFAPMTVSRVINGEQNVRQETREAVQAAIAKLRYSPNLAARTLAGAEQVRIGMLYSNPSAAFLSEFLVGSLEQARLSHVQLVVEKFDPDQNEEQVVNELLATGVDGIILPPPLCDSKRIHAVIAKAGALAVAVASAIPRPGLLAVRIDDHAAAMAMTRHILSLGHTRIGFIIGNPDQTASAQRLAGYKAALIEADIPLDNALIRQGLFTYRSGLKAAEQLLALAKPPTAIFASNDDMGAATVAVAHRHHLDVPRGLTVCGFDDTEFSRSIWPELTTIRQPIADMSKAAMLLLLKRIKARREGHEGDLKQTLLDFTLVRRDSDGPPPRS